MTSTPRIPVPESLMSSNGYVDEDQLFSLYVPLLAAARRNLYAATRGTGVDEVVKETVRIRNARVTQCDVCRNIRLAGARAQGLTEDLVDQIDDHYESAAGLAPRQKAALRFADRFLTRPHHEPEQVRARMSQHFSESETVALAVELLKYRTFSKMFITLGNELDEMSLTVVTPRLPVRESADA